MIGTRTTRARSAALRLVAVSALASAAACGSRPLSLVSVQDEIAIGREANAQVRRETAEVRDARVLAYLRDVGRRLAQAAPGPRYPYSFAMADYREINAFALPGGPVWVHRGAVHAAASEAQLAGVLAHEVAHIAQRHAADQLTKVTVARWGLGVLGALLGNSGGAGTAQVAAGLLANGMFLKFSREAEREADTVGLAIMTRAGWDGEGMIALFETLRREARRDPGALEVFLSSHPSPQDRITALRAAVARRRGGRQDSREFQAVRARLLAMRPPRAMPR